MPSPQLSHEPFPTSAWNCPAVHCEQTSSCDAADDKYWPAAHVATLQTTAPVSICQVPLPQAMQLCFAASAWKVPAAHASQLCLPVSSSNRPAAQSEQAFASDDWPVVAVAECLPAAQPMQDAFPVSVWYWPTWQLEHA